MTSRLLSVAAALAVASITTAAALSAQTSAPVESVQVLVLGTYHFANPGLDVVRTDVADVMSRTKQAEIAAVVDAVARFRPTKIAVERVPAFGPRMDSTYAAYRRGEHELTRDETEQLGFRLAARLDHPRLYPIDHRGEFPFGAMMEYAQAHDPAFVAYVQEERARLTTEGNRQQLELTVGEILRRSNDPRKLAADHGTYMRFARVGAGDTYVGADLLAKWYDRNIRIFTNLQRLAEPGDRILVLIGSGHAPILRELITYDPEMLLVEAVDYLPGG